MARPAGDAPPGAGLLVAAEVALTLLTVATVASMWRLFDDGSYFLPLAGHAVGAHAVATILRRRGVGTGLAAVVCVGAGLLALTWAHLGSATTYGIPTGETLRAARDQLDLAWTTFGDVRAPAPVLTGFLLSAGAAVWVGAFLADMAAFRFWTPFEGLIPAGTLFIFASLFAADRSRALAGALWLATALVFVLVHRTAAQQGSPSWLGSDARVGGRALLRVGTALTVVAVGIGWLVGPHLPGADAEPIVPFAPDDGGSRTTVSPLVEIRGRLVEQSAVEVFRVQADRRAYWRLTSLDIFDGNVWSSRGSFGGADGRLDGSGRAEVPTTPVTQAFAISGLNAIWLPAAFEAAEIDPGDAEVRWDDVSSTLIVSTDHPTSDGLRYTVVSDVPTFEAATLAAAGSDVPDDIAERALGLPSDFPATVVDLARQVVGSAASPYEKALALQTFFQSQFTYSLEVPPGHSDTAIESFLFDTRTGYCEQFAGSYAAMARAVGLPARVAVGFTPGEPDPGDPRTFVVRGEHAHAWPEVWIAGAGWVAFEPTPGRGAPGAEGYTGLPASQDTAGPETAPTTDTTAPPVGPDPTTGDGAAAPTTATSLGDLGAEPEPLAPAEDGSGGGIPRFVVLVLLAVLGLVLAVVLAGVAVAATRAVGRRRRRARAAAVGPEAVVAQRWQELTDLGPLVGVTRRAFETPRELGTRLAHATGDTGAAALADLVTRAAFDPVGVGEEGAAEAVALADGIGDALRATTGRWARIRHAVDPRPAHRRGRRRDRPSGPRIQIRLAPTASGD